MKKQHLPTKTALAIELNLSRVTLNRYLGMPSAPEKTKRGWNFLEVQEFIKRSTVSTRTRRRVDPEFARLVDELKRLKNEELRFDLDVKKGRLVLVEEVEKQISQQVSAAKILLRSKFENELPPICEGLSAAQIQIHNRTALDEAFTVFTTSTRHQS